MGNQSLVQKGNQTYSPWRLGEECACNSHEYILSVVQECWRSWCTWYAPVRDERGLGDNGTRSRCIEYGIECGRTCGEESDHGSVGSDW